MFILRCTVSYVSYENSDGMFIGFFGKRDKNNKPSVQQYQILFAEFKPYQVLLRSLFTAFEYSLNSQFWIIAHDAIQY